MVKHNEYRNILKKNRVHFDKLAAIIEQSQEELEGNCFTVNGSDEEAEKLQFKQMNMFTLAREAQSILEIGFNAGHSCLIMLLANPKSQIKCFDINVHAYTKPCFEYLNKTFKGRLELISQS